MRRAWLRDFSVLALASALAGCLLPEYENGPLPASTAPSDSGAGDGPGEWLPKDVTVPDAPDGTDIPDASDAWQDADVIEPDAGFCEVHADGTVCGPNDLCHEQVCSSGDCVLVEIPDGVVCDPAPNACWEPGRCQAGVCGSPEQWADGHNWDPTDTWRRCCGGAPLRLDTNANCGVCGIQCVPSDGQSCTLNPANAMYYCEGCTASVACWSGCCSVSFGQPYRCAASDCEGNCISCPNGATCMSSGQASLVCVYE